MQNKTTDKNDARLAPTAVVLAMAKTDPRPHPFTDDFLSELERTDDGQRMFNYEALSLNGKRPEFDRPQFIEWMQTTDATEWLSEGPWASVREQVEAQFAEAETLHGLSPQGWRRMPLFNLASPEEIETLRGIQSRMKEIETACKPFSLANVTTRVQTLRDEQAAAIRAGNATPGLLPTREQVSADSLARLNAYQAQLADITQKELLPLARAILERFHDVAANSLRRTELRDREACAIMGIEFHPSLEWKCAAQVTLEYKPSNRLPKSPSAVASPRQLVGDLINL